MSDDSAPCKVFVSVLRLLCVVGVSPRFLQGGRSPVWRKLYAV